MEKKLTKTGTVEVEEWKRSTQKLGQKKKVKNCNVGKKIQKKICFKSILNEG